MASFGPLQSSGMVALSDFEFTHLSIHPTLKRVLQTHIVLMVMMLLMTMLMMMLMMLKVMMMVALFVLHYGLSSVEKW